MGRRSFVSPLLMIIGLLAGITAIIVLKNPFDMEGLLEAHDTAIGFFLAFCSFVTLVMAAMGIYHGDD